MKSVMSDLLLRGCRGVAATRGFAAIVSTLGVLGLSATSVAAAPLQDGDFTFSITSSTPPGGTCTDGSVDNTCEQILNSISIGATTYTSFTFPSGFSVSGFPAGSDVQSRIYDTPGDFVFSSPTYAADMLTNVFSDRDLNRYQQVDSNGTLGTSTYTYPTPIPATGNFFLITTERNGNNDQVIQAFDQFGAPLTTVTINAGTPDYTDTNRRVGFNQNSFLAVIPMSDFADASDASRQVQSIEISYTGNDGADHKTFVIGSNPIEAVNDDLSGAPVNSASGGVTASVLANDTLAGSSVAVDGSETTLSITDLDGLTGATIADDGTITVPAGAMPGTYTVAYELCEQTNLTNCDPATATIVVAANAIAAVNDDYSSTPISGATGGSFGPVLGNDTLNGTAVAADGSETTVMITDLDGLTGATLADDGTLTVPAGATPGTYTLTYQLCEEANGTNCDTATITVVVSGAGIAAVDDTYTSDPVDGFTGGTVGSVLDNDTLAGSAVATDGSETTLTITDLDGLTGATLADDGTLTIPAGTATATYVVTYELCEAGNLTNCDTATATIAVQNTSLIAAIEDELLEILEDDLSATLAQQSLSMGNYAAGALARLKSNDSDACAAAATLAARGVYFDTDKAILKPRSEAVLDEVAAVLKSCEGDVFEIGGHTDSDASDAYNIALSQRRVNAVLNALTARGVNTAGYVAQGYGESRPIASNATAEGKAQNRRVVFTPLENAPQLADTCMSPNGPARAFDVSANETGVSVDGSLKSENYNCVSGYWAIVEGSLSYLENDNGLSQGAANLSYRRERFVGEDSVRGYFVGVYGSQSDIDRAATGEINGFGLNAGVYGAQKLQNALFVDYYLGAATGMHDFDLSFETTGDPIDATGDYRYLAGFAGAALSGDMDYDSYTLTPRAGFAFAYAPGGEVDVAATQAGLSQSGTLDLDAVSGGLFFAEMRAERALGNADATVALTPRLSCYQSFGSIDEEFSIGASFELFSAETAEDMSYGVEIEGERGDTFSRSALSARFSQQLGLGQLDLDTGLTSDGAVHVGSKMEWKF